MSLQRPAGSVVIPGDPTLALPESGAVRVGQGLVQEEDMMLCSRAGVVRSTRQGRVWVEGSQKRYIPQVREWGLKWG
jgi:exosome complex RNA-binding protein Rrp4